MKHNLRLALIAATALALSACGGGGGSGSATSTVFDGVVASGAAYPAGTGISVSDATGTEVGTTTLSKDDGTYSVTLSTSAKAPFVIKATPPEDSERETLVSIAADSSNATVNVSPLSHFMAARISTTGNPLDLVAAPAAITTASVSAALSEAKQLIASVEGTVTTDPLNGKFIADGKGLDKVLDRLDLAVTPSSATSSSISVAIRGSDTAAVEIKAGSGKTDTAAMTTQVDSVKTAAAATAAPADGLSAQVAALQDKLNACYALKQADRVNKTDSTATATDIKADACKAVFATTNGSIAYLHNGRTIGGNSNTKTFAGLFTKTDDYTVKFDKGNYQYMTAKDNGDVVYVSNWTTKDANGNQVNGGVDTMVARFNSDKSALQ